MVSKHKLVSVIKAFAVEPGKLFLLSWVSIFKIVSLFLIIWSICIRKTNSFIFSLIKSFGISSTLFYFIIWAKLIHNFICLAKSECKRSRVLKFQCLNLKFLLLGVYELKVDFSYLSRLKVLQINWRKVAEFFFYQAN